MSGQEVKIGVKAETQGGVHGIGKIEDAFDDTSKAAEGVASAVQDAGKSIDDAVKGAKKLHGEFDRVEQSVRRIRETQRLLSRDLGKSISLPDTAQFLDNFDKMRAGRGIGSQKLRAFSSYENWRTGVGTAFKRPADADRHRRFIMSAAMQGTTYADENGQPPPLDEDDPPPPGGGGFRRGVARAGSTAMSFGKGMLAMAGIASVAGMAAAGVDMATEESVGTDTLKRLMGDLGQSFDKLQDQTRGATTGMGMTYVESVRLGQQFARTAGDMRGVDLGSSLHGSYNFARRFGTDPSEAVQFFGTMQRMKLTSGSAEDTNRMAMMIGAAIDKSGYTGKADEVLGAVANFATDVARVTLSKPNVGAYASWMTGLMKTGYPGLDPSGAASLLGTINGSISRGGAAGDASMNFSYAALSKYSHGMSPFDAQALWAAGAMGTTRSVFGPGTPLGRDYKARGLSTPGLDDVTNLQKEIEYMRHFTGGKERNAALAGQFGITTSQAAAMFNMSPAELNAEGTRLAKEGEKTPGSEVRESIADLKNELTKVGDLLLVPLNGIRDAVVAMANVLAPDRYKQPSVGDGTYNSAGEGRTSSFMDRTMRAALGDKMFDSAQVNRNETEGHATFGNATADDIADMAKTDQLLGLPAGSTYRQLLKESGGRALNHGAYNKKSGAMGWEQVMPAQLRHFEKLWGRKLNPYDNETGILINREMMRENLKHFKGNYNDALAGYNGGWDPAKWHNSETSDYVKTLTGGKEIHVVVTGDGHIPITDGHGKKIGKVALKAKAQPQGGHGWLGHGYEPATP